jgi:uncharacterized iron-regulated membrane protein
MNATNPVAPRPRNRLLAWSRKWHLWSGLLAALFLLIAGGTGIVLNYKKPIFTALGLEPESAGKLPAHEMASAGSGNTFTTATGLGAAGISVEQALQLARAELGTVPLERIELKSEHGALVWKIKEARGAEFWVDAQSGSHFIKGEYERVQGQNAHGQPVKSFDWGKFFLKLHTGEIGGAVGKAIMTVGAAILLFLSASGVYMWAKPLLIRRANVRAKTQTKSAVLVAPSPQPSTTVRSQFAEV